MHHFLIKKGDVVVSLSAVYFIYRSDQHAVVRRMFANYYQDNY